MADACWCFAFITDYNKQNMEVGAGRACQVVHSGDGRAAEHRASALQYEQQGGDARASHCGERAGWKRLADAEVSGSECGGVSGEAAGELQSADREGNSVVFVEYHGGNGGSGAGERESAE